MKGCIVLLSGGLDSATTLAVAKSQNFTPYALSFAYGQRQAIEIEAARRIAHATSVAEHRIVHLDLGAFGGSALTSKAYDIPKDRSTAAMREDIPITYVPARNTIFLSYALAWAEVLEISDIFIGANAVDYSGYPDCRPEFIAAFEKMANLATRASVLGHRLRIHTPLMHLSKSEIILLGSTLAVDYAPTHSCYDPVGQLACGHCDSCILRRDGFLQAGVADPTQYV
jgi:7-cyano-7-deazaguanine synthase